MVSGWRLAFCTTVPKDTDHTTTKRIATDGTDQTTPTPTTSRFGFFSSASSAPKLHGTSGLRCRTAFATAPVSQASSVANSPKLSCKTSSSSSSASAKNSPMMFHRSCPSSPTSASSFSLLKSTLRLSRPRCGVCLQSVRAGQGTAIFTAECSHGFHFPCVVELVKKQSALFCPVCNAPWKELPLLENRKPRKSSEIGQEDLKSLKTKEFNSKPSDLKIYNDDEPLMSPTAGTRFNPIPESDYENDDDEETRSLTGDSFRGFFTSAATNSPVSTNIAVKLLPDSAVVSAARGYQTLAVVMEVKAPSSPARPNAKASSFRAPVDLVAVVDVSNSMSGSDLQTMKRAMRVLISSLSSNDRLSVVAFSACSKRLLPLRRMTVDGRRAARRIIDVISATGQGMSAGDAVRKAAKVLEDRRVKNSVATIIVLSNGSDSSNKSSSNLSRHIFSVQSTRLHHLNIPVHSFTLGGACDPTTSFDEAFVKSIAKLLCVPVQDLRLQFGSVHGSVEVKGVYSCTGRTRLLGLGIELIKLGDFHAEENREILIELRVPITKRGAHSAVSVRSSYTDPSSQQLVLGRDQALPVPNPIMVASSSSTCHKIERLRCLFISARAVAESKRVAERNDFSGAHHLLSSARALVVESKSASAGEFVAGLDAELAELKWRRQQAKLQWEKAIGRSVEVNKEEALTPTSAWRTAERLAKVARMRKSLNRVSDLHGFENARF